MYLLRAAYLLLLKGWAVQEEGHNSLAAFDADLIFDFSPRRADVLPLHHTHSSLMWCERVFSSDSQQTVK
jgi:hypothetical protein